MKRDDVVFYTLCALTGVLMAWGVSCEQRAKPSQPELVRPNEQRNRVLPGELKGGSKR